MGGLTAGRFSLRERQVQQRFTFRSGLRQPPPGRGMEGFAFDRQHRILMGWVKHLLMAIESAPMTGDLGGAIEDSNQRIGSH